jgi:hypothetical protein
MKLTNEELAVCESFGKMVVAASRAQALEHGWDIVEHLNGLCRRLEELMAGPVSFDERTRRWAQFAHEFNLTDAFLAWARTQGIEIRHYAPPAIGVN